MCAIKALERAGDEGHHRLNKHPYVIPLTNIKVRSDEDLEATTKQRMFGSRYIGEAGDHLLTAQAIVFIISAL